MNRRLAIAISTLTASFATPSCSGGGCHVRGCPPTAEIAVDLPSSWDRLVQATATVCRNELCVTGTVVRHGDAAPELYGLGFSAPSPSPDAGAGDAGLSNSGGAAPRPVEVTIVARQGSPLLLVTWPAGLAAKGGDTYRVTVTEAGGAALVGLTETVSAYEVSHPNGTSCTPTCQSIRIDRSTPVPDR